MAGPENNNPAPNGHHPETAAPSPNGADPRVEPMAAAPTERYMIATRRVPGFAPASASDLANALPGVKIVRRLQPRGLNAFSVGAPMSQTPEILVAEMDRQRGLALQASAPPNVIVERDAFLRYSDDLRPFDFNGVMPIAAGVGVDVQIRVIGAGGKPLPKATVYVYGPGFPGQGLTNERGEVVVTVFGGPIQTIRAIYVKPVADHWDRMLQGIALQAGAWNTVQLRPLTEKFAGFPQQGMIGWGQRLMKLDRLDPSFNGSGVKIGIIDSGCDSAHPQLRHVTRGADLTNGGDKASWANDMIGHGTHCAGIITAASDTVAGIRGFAPQAEVHSLKVFPGGRFSDLIDALDECVDRQLDVVNMSLGSGEPSELVAQKIAEARQNGVACIVAAGNSSGPVQFPGVLPTVLTVAALGKLEEFPEDSYHAQTVEPQLVAGALFSPKFTCFGPQVAVGAPGVAIVSTVPGGGYAAWDGTSMATPHVTGMAALLLAHHPLLQAARAARNEQRVAQLFSLLASSGVRYLGDPTREGVGAPDFERVPGLAAPQPIGAATPASAGPAPMPGWGGNGFAPMGAPIGSVMGPTAWAVNPAALQRFMQLRAAGLI
ncbi:S8 family serine peptidase [Methylocystis sp. 9N]|uniref:S8 family serine peptidase n=1 Tax=Methylocystis borbori TaxID=3118750 RepID=A0ABU7XH95_9HYPH